MNNKLQLTEFVSEILNKIDTPERPDWDDYFMATALLLSSRSNCDRLRVGCVLVSTGEQKNRIIASGYNGFMAGAPHILRVRDDHDQATVHAEQNAITDAARRGVSIQGTIAYITHLPCIHCSKLLVASGIKEIKYYFDYKNDQLAAELLAEYGINITKL